MKIAGTRVHVIPMSDSWLTESVIANPMSRYPAYREKRSSWFGKMSGAIIEIVTDDGVSGLGFSGGGKGTAVKTIVDDHFSALLIGQDPFDIERLWDQLFRASLPYGRKGLAMDAISGIDIALWDIVGKITAQPVFKLIGGRTKDRIPAYVTGNLMAAAHDLPVIPHGVGAATYHFIMATPNAPEAEFVDIFAQGGEPALEGEPVPRGGFVEISEAPGFGYRLNPRATASEAGMAPIW